MSTGQDQYYDKGKDIFNIRGQSQGIYVLKLNVLDLCVFETSLAIYKAMQELKLALAMAMIYCVVDCC